MEEAAGGSSYWKLYKTIRRYTRQHRTEYSQAPVAFVATIKCECFVIQALQGMYDCSNVYPGYLRQIDLISQFALACHKP